jgi:hypothetical protein
VRGSLQPFHDMAAYLISRCLGPDLVAYLLALGVIVVGLLAKRLPAGPAQPRRWLSLKWLGLPVGCLLGLVMKDPVLLSGGAPWLAARLALTTLGLSAMALIVLAQGPAVENKIPRWTVMAGGLFIGWMVGFLAEGMVSMLWPI